MGLTSEEQRRLDEVAAGNTATDPDLARVLSTPSGQRAQLRRPGPRSMDSVRLTAVAIVLTGLGMPLLVLGLAFQLPLLFLFGVLTLCFGPLLALLRRSTRRRGPDG